MNGHIVTKRARVNITLPHDTLRVLSRIGNRGNRSRLIEHAVRFYIRALGKENVRKRLREGALARQERDLLLSTEWFPFDEEVWHGKKRK